MTYDFNKETKLKIQNDNQPMNLQMTNTSRPLISKEDEDPYVGQHGAFTNMELIDKLQELSEPDDIHHIRKMIQTHFTNKMFKIIEEILSCKNLAEYEYSDDE